jgi:hypothetical protein
MKKAIATLIILLMSITFVTAAAVPAQRDITVTIDGAKMEFPDQKPYIENSRTLVPVRFVTEALGAEVEWLQTEQKVRIQKGSELIELVIGQSKVKAGSKTVQLDVPAKIKNSRTMVPLRFVSEALGAGVEWDQTTYTVSIITYKNDLLSVPITSEALVKIYPVNDPQKVDFMFLIELYKPIEPQYIDVENLLTARFGKDNATVNEIMEYIKSKDTRKKDLPDRKWIINNQTVLVGSDPNSWTFPIMVWRVVK